MEKLLEAFKILCSDFDQREGTIQRRILTKEIRFAMTENKG